MRIGIVSPSKIDYLEEINPRAGEILKALAEKLSKNNHEIVITPDKGSVSELFGEEYNEAKGKKIWEIIPLEDREFGFDYVNMELGEHINCGTWRNQPEKFNEETDALLVLGYSVGGLFEIGYSKWLKPKKVYIITELITEKLPEELNRSLDIEYVSYENFNP